MSIEKLIEGLSYQSETDAPFEVVPAEVIDFETFFAPLIKSQDWYGKDEATAVEEFRLLHECLVLNLNNKKVFKFGGAEKDIYIVGTDSKGKLFALKTKAVES